MTIFEKMREAVQLNADKPDPALLPTPRQLRRSTIAAAIGAAFIGICVYLPAEYGTDPTGVGNILGLTEMGEIKQQLAREAAEDELIHGGETSPRALSTTSSASSSARPMCRKTGPTRSPSLWRRTPRPRSSS